MQQETADAVAAVFHASWGRLVGGLARETNDLALAEDSVQEALEAAIGAWPRMGIPERPEAWVRTAARRAAIDRIRRDRTLTRKTELLAAMTGAAGTDEMAIYDVDAPDEMRFDDDLLGLIFACSHPALTLETRIALTLRAVCGLTPGQIARAFLIPQRTLDQRLVRARRKIRDAGIPLRVPPGHLLPERLPAVLRVVYLVFNEGYLTTEGDQLLAVDLCEEAIRLGRALANLMPDEPEALALQALMTLHHARRATRADNRGELIPLEEQDRSRWDSTAIATGQQLLERALRMQRTGVYQIQAAIAALHAGAPRAAETDWAQIAGLYGLLMRRQPSPLLALNRAVAIGMADGPDAGLALLPALEGEPSLAGNHLLPAVRADLERRSNRYEAAASAYRQALALVSNASERTYLERRLTEVTRPPTVKPAGVSADDPA